METVRRMSGQPAKTEKQNRDPIAILLILFRLILGGIFLWSGGAKLLDPAAFQVEISNFQLVSWKFAGAIALYLPWLELVCGIALITGKQLHGALALLSVLMIVFIFVVASAWFRGLDVTCGCFGASDATVSYPLWIARNVLILAGLIGVLIGEKWKPRSKKLPLTK